MSLSKYDKLVRDWFVEKAKALGCEILIDEMGNIFAIWNGTRKEGHNKLLPIGMGSHLDTQPLGGRFDGILGVLSALEVIRTVKEAGLVLQHPLAAVNWTNEEGARFPIMCSGSNVWSGTKSISDLHSLSSLTEPEKTMKSELTAIGYLGSTKCSHKVIPLAAHFELHIEQACRLEDSGNEIGAVTGVQGMRWYEVHIYGKEGHAGSTLMELRADAMVATAKLILFVQQEAEKQHAFGTVGFVKPKSESPNTIIGEVKLVIDLRHPSEQTLDKIEATFQEFLIGLEVETKGLKTSFCQTWKNVAAEFDVLAIQAVQEAAMSVVGSSWKQMISYAAHDSAETAKVVPTAMIFIPSLKGVSHNPAEYSTPEQCATGAQVLLESVLRYSEMVLKRDL